MIIVIIRLAVINWFCLSIIYFLKKLNKQFKETKTMKQLLSAALLALIIATGCKKTKTEDHTYEVNSATSVAEWKGAAPDHFHVGSFPVKGVLTTATDGTIKEGKFIIPIASIRDFDLSDPVRQQLLDHLKSPDFFNMALHPNAEFEITKIENYSGHDGIDNANKLVTGDFTMTGQTHSISFPATVNYVADSLKVSSTFTIDRTKWGMTKYSNPDSAEYIIPNAAISLNVQAAKQ